MTQEIKLTRICSWCGEEQNLIYEKGLQFWDHLCEQGDESAIHLMVHEPHHFADILKRMVEQAYEACYLEYMECPWCSGHIGVGIKVHDEGCMWVWLKGKFYVHEIEENKNV
ncbi:hypothetical protein LCGC14_0680350 [marine sediment metagenome]|uniref:Uncharacterized protein n=1 Tax=marine sediment metagenome TaxID=412755 RepID=A0A0F9R8N8_9ZZZZ